VDSGISLDHPHVGVVTDRVRVAIDIHTDDVLDRLGHGTAVAAAIREKAPACELLSVKVFDRALTTDAETLAAGIIWAADHGCRLISLSLGTPNQEREELLRGAVQHAALRGAIVVSAAESDGVRWLPGSLPGVAGVLVDWESERRALAVEFGEENDDGPARFKASAYPRPIPGVPRERNVSGISFAVANVTGFLARLMEANPAARTLRDLGPTIET
jgi:subtilisin family serine protease